MTESRSLPDAPVPALSTLRRAWRAPAVEDLAPLARAHAAVADLGRRGWVQLARPFEPDEPTGLEDFNPSNQTTNTRDLCK